MKASFAWFAIGAMSALLVGAVLIWVFRLQVLESVSGLYGHQIVGKTSVLERNVYLYQDGTQVGSLNAGVRIVHRVTTESLDEFVLPIGWDGKATGDRLVRETNLDRAFVTMEAH